MIRDFAESDDTYDEEISLGTKPGVPAEYESRCVHETQLQAKDASLQEAHNEIAKLKSRNNRLETAMMETRKNAYEAEEKARVKGQNLTIAKKAIIDNNTQIDDLERRNTELNTILSNTTDKSNKMHEELVYWKTKYANDYKEAVRLGSLHKDLGADLFSQMTELEVMIANGCGTFFFKPQDVELKIRALQNLPLNPASQTTQTNLFKALKGHYADDDVLEEIWTAVGGLRRAIEAPPINDEKDELLRILNSAMKKLPHVIDQETRVVDELEHFQPTTPAKSIPEANVRSGSGETSLSSPVAESNSEEGRPDSATSNELEQGSSMCNDSIAGSIVVPGTEDSSNDESWMRSLLGYNPNPEEAFYPQYEKASDLPVSNESVEETFELQGPQSSSGVVESPLTCYESATGPGVTWMLGINPEPEELFYPQYTPRNENEEHSASTASIPQHQERTSATVPENEPIFDIKLEVQTTTTTMADSKPLAVNISFADTAKNFKEEIAVRMEREDTSSADSTELEHKDTTSTEATTPIFTPQVSESSSPTTTAPTSRNSSINLTFSNPSTKQRLSRTQRREAAIKEQQAEATMAAKKEADECKAKDEGEKMSRQERRAAERMAWKKALKQPWRNIVRF